MKKLYATIMLLAMMVAALGLTACGGDDDEGNGGGDDGGLSSATFTITIDGNKHEYLTDYLDNWGSWENIVILIETHIGPLRFQYPSSTTFSSFTSGYSSFAEDSEKVTIGITSPQECTHSAGLAKVVSNDGKKMKVQFSNYTFTWKTSREIILDGTLNIVFRF